MLFFEGTTLDSPLHYVNSTRALAHTGLRFPINLTHSPSARQFMGTASSESMIAVSTAVEATTTPMTVMAWREEEEDKKG